MNINELPESVVKDIKAKLGHFSEARVWKKGEEYKVVAHIGISASKSAWEFVSEFSSAEVFSNEERIINYVNNFKDFPYCVDKDHLTYRGKKDYKAIRSNWNEVTLNNDGNLVFS
tara:strand:- start:182 stop:526 length:345 start_codon:yes stop_codon:yes gene_type:complete